MQKYKIYTFWWQGFDEAPEIIKACHNSLCKHYDCNRQELIVLDKNNVFDYVNLPDFILKKFEAGIISITHLSDIIRFSLLKLTGGIWVDASMYFTKDINPNLFERNLFSMKNKSSKRGDITSIWEVFFIGGEKNHPLFCFLEDALLSYWKNEDDIITYLLTEHFIYILYENNKKIADELNNCDSFYYATDYFQNKMNYEFSKLEFEKEIANEPYFKLSYKGSFSKVTKNLKQTLYGYLVDGVN